jgi:hypothetical protein
MATTKEKAVDRVAEMRPYVQRALKDEELRENLLAAFAAAKEVYSELVGDRGVTTVASKVATDKDVQENLKRAVDELRHAADRLQGKEDHTTRNTMFLLFGITIGLLFNPVTGPATRSWVKNRVFGSNDEFGYGGAGDGTQPPPQT